MAEFPSDLQAFRSSSIFPLMGLDHQHHPNMGMGSTNQLITDTINPNFLDNPNFNFQSLTPFCHDNFQLAHQLPEILFPNYNLAENFLGNSHHQPVESTENNEVESHESKKRKALVDVSAESCSLNSSPQVSENGAKKANFQSSRRRGKRMKGSHEEEDEEKASKEVVHVRARRGQATDSHSLAERVRRSKINERIKCLRDIVPGCYKTMGMAVMLDEIINYVQSLQSQVEFLSMKLTAASKFYDFNAETDALEALQRTKAQEVKELERWMMEGYGGHGSSYSTWSP